MTAPLHRQLAALSRRIIRTGQTADRVAALAARRVTVPLTGIAVGASTVDITWAPPINRPYLVVVTVLTLPVNLPLLCAAVQPPSRHAFGATLDVFSTALAPIANATLDVLIIPF